MCQDQSPIIVKNFRLHVLIVRSPEICGVILVNPTKCHDAYQLSVFGGWKMDAARAVQVGTKIGITSSPCGGEAH